MVLKVLAWIIGIILLMVLALAIAVAVSKAKENSIKDAKLTGYIFAKAGGSNGGGRSTSVRAYDDTRAIISYASKDYYYDSPEVAEYLVDIKILDDIRAVFDKYHMKRWSGKSFTNMKIADGSTTSYDFYFDNKNSIHFASQYFSQRYLKKLSKFEDVLKSYEGTGEACPGLVVTVFNNDEQEMKTNGQVNLFVTEYSLGKLYFRIINGTDETIDVAFRYLSLYREGENEPIYSQEFEQVETVAPELLTEGYTDEALWLQPGIYELKVGMTDEVCCSFEIR